MVKETEGKNYKVIRGTPDAVVERVNELISGTEYWKPLGPVTILEPNQPQEMFIQTLWRE